MDHSRDIEDAIYAEEIRAEMDEQDRIELEDRIKSNWELDKITRESKTCKKFLESDIGRLIVSKAAEHSEIAKDKLAGLKMADYKSTDHYLDAIKELQRDAHTPALVVTWIYGVIQKAEEEAKLIYEE